MTLHRYLGAVVILMLLTIFLWGIGLLVARRDETPVGMRALQHWTENLLAVQVVLGIVLLFMGRRVLGSYGWLHYLYGSVFPLVAILWGRLADLRRERRGFMGLAWGAFFALGLTLRALQTGCGESIEQIVRCMSRL